MGRSVAVLLLDDGELDDVQECLEQTGIAFGRVRGGAIVANTPPPERLLVATPRRVDAVRLPPAGSEKGRALVRIVVVQEDSTTMREQLRRIGFDFLVRRPVHPEALRLLILRSIYSGEERRREERVAMGVEVSFRTGLLPRRATMVDLSSRGCRLLSSYVLEPGRRVHVQVPDGTREPIPVRGQVVRMSLDEHLGPDGPYSAAVAFDPLAEPEQARLARVLARRARGPARLGASAGEDALVPPEARADDLRRVELPVDVRVSPGNGAAQEIEVADEPAHEDAEPGTEERRRGTRSAYKRRIPAFGDRAMRVLVARDLSTGGMRVERTQTLRLGQRFRIALHVGPGETPLVVHAEVARDDGLGGFMLRFRDLTAAAERYLVKMIDTLPVLETRNSSAERVVVSEILTQDDA